MSGKKATPDAPASRRSRLRNRRIGTKLVIILALPMLVVLALGGLIADSAVAGSARAEQARRLVSLGGTAADLAAQLQQERAAAALVFARRSSPPALEEYRKASAASDAAASRFRAARTAAHPPANLDVLLRRVEGQLVGLPALRQQVQAAPDAASSVVVFRYRAVVADLVSYRQGLSQIGVGAQTANNLRASAALSQAIESLGLMQVAVVRALDGGQLTPAAQQEVVAADAGLTEALQAFQDLAPPQWPSLLNTRVSGTPVLQAERLQGVVTRAAPDTALRLGTDPAGWAAAVAARMLLMHAVERELDGELLADVARQRDEQRTTIWQLSAAVAGGVLVMALITLWVARSLTGSLRRLRAGAETMARVQLPHMVAQLATDRPDPAAIERMIAAAAAPLKVDGTDEVAQVAAAFNTVGEVAAQLAGEQAALRAGVASILKSLSLRLQQRIDRMMASLDGLEKNETDPAQLEKLFALDHVATLIRRMIANLQIIAGVRASRAAAEPVALPDLLRAASSEIDDYLRVETGQVDDTVYVGRDAAEDLIHLLAELLDNGARFSPPGTRVVVDARRVGDRLHIQITDWGIGISPADLDAVRDRVANPFRIDHQTTQQMGLPVVGRIAARLKIIVEHRASNEHGTVVDVTVPGELLDVAPPPPDTASPPDPAGVARQTVAVVDDRTREMPALMAGPAAMSPPPWPPVAPAATISAQRQVPLVIYEQVRQSWFTAVPDASAPAQPAVPADWQAAAAAAEAVRTAAPARTTPNGLPMRQPGQRVIPSVTANRAPRTPMRRDPDEMRRQMAAFDQGLGAAGRRSHRIFVEEPAR
jgi:signal transduction histidine kinase